MDDDVQSDSEIISGARWKLTVELERAVRDFKKAETDYHKSKLVSNYKKFGDK